MALANPIVTQPPTNIGAGLRFTAISASFAGTALTLNLQIPVANVVKVDLSSVPTQIVSGTTFDRIMVNNSLNSLTGLYTLLANSTNQPYISLPNVIQLSRTGTNSQDVVVSIYSKG